MLPCNVTLIGKQDGTTDVSVMDPVVALQAVDNIVLEAFAQEVRTLLESTLNNVG